VLERFGRLAEQALPGSVLFVVRDYALSARARFQLARALSALAARHRQMLGVADRADIARAVSGQALHLPERGVSTADARSVVAPGTFISRAQHEPSTALDADADAVLLSPIFELRKERPALGLEVLERVCRARLASSPLVYALGGVTAEQAGGCLTVGAAGVAVIGAALEPDPRPLLRALQISG